MDIWNRPISQKKSDIHQNQTEFASHFPYFIIEASVVGRIPKLSPQDSGLSLISQILV